MNHTYLEKIMSSDAQNLPTLDEVVQASLEYFSDTEVPRIDVQKHIRPLVVGSVNALSTGRIIFAETDAVFADEGTFHSVLARSKGIDAVYIFSASGGKHAVIIAEQLKASTLPVYLITSNPSAPARVHIPDERVFVFPHIREPYSYNTSTYMGMLLGAFSENPREILSFIEDTVLPAIPDNFKTYDSFVLTLPPEYGAFRDMLRTKFDELFAPLCSGRVFTSEEIKHAKIVIPSDTQGFVHFGTPHTAYANDSQQCVIPIPDRYSPVAMLAISYFVVGHIQKQHPQYFKENIQKYVETASKVFGQPMSVIVE